MHRRRGATPALDGADEMLRRLDRHWGVQAQRRPGRVGTSVAFVPLRALDKPDRFGAAEHRRLAAHPQQPPALVRDGQYAVAVLGGVAGHVVQQREDLGQRVLGPVVGEQVRRQRDGWRAAVRVHARRRRPQPRVGDHPSHAHRDCPPLQQVLAGLADARDSGPAGQSGQLRGSDHDQPQKLGTACWLQSGISHCQPAGPDDVRYKVPETVVIGHAAPGPSAPVADGGLA